MNYLFYISVFVSMLSMPTFARTWTNVSGKTLEAEIKEYDPKTKEVIITRVDDGKEFRIPVNNLSQEDKNFIISFQKDAQFKNKWASTVESVYTKMTELKSLEKDLLDKPSTDRVKSYLEKGGRVDIRDEKNNTILMKACELGDIKLVELLLKEGADVNMMNEEEKSALIFAINKGSVPIVRLLIKNHAELYNFEDYFKKDLQPILLALHNQQFEIFDALLQSIQVMHHELAYTLSDTAKELDIPAEFKEKVQSSFGREIIGNEYNLSIIKEKIKPDRVPFSLDSSLGFIRAIPLLSKVFYQDWSKDDQQKEIALYLLEELKLKPNGRLPLALQTKLTSKDIDKLSLFLKYVDKEDLSYYLNERGGVHSLNKNADKEVIAFLKKEFSNMGIKLRIPLVELIKADNPVVKDNADPTQFTFNDLIVACNKGEVEKFKLILENNPNFSYKIRDIYGRSALMYVCKGGANLANKKAMIQLLLDKGASLAEKDFYGKNCLCYAIIYGNKELEDFIIALGLSEDQTSKKERLMKLLSVTYPSDKGKLEDLDPIWENENLFLQGYSGVYDNIDYMGHNVMNNGYRPFSSAERKASNNKDQKVLDFIEKIQANEKRVSDILMSANMEKIKKLKEEGYDFADLILEGNPMQNYCKAQGVFFSLKQRTADFSTFKYFIEQGGNFQNFEIDSFSPHLSEVFNYIIKKGYNINKFNYKSLVDAVKSNNPAIADRIATYVTNRTNTNDNFFDLQYYLEGIDEAMLKKLINYRCKDNRVVKEFYFYAVKNNFQNILSEINDEDRLFLLSSAIEKNDMLTFKEQLKNSGAIRLLRNKSLYDEALDRKFYDIVDYIKLLSKAIN